MSSLNIEQKETVATQFRKSRKPLFFISMVFIVSTVFWNNCSQQQFSLYGSSISAMDIRTCKPGPGATGSPKSIEEAVALVNSLPKPVTVPCFLESLDRPLKIYATISTGSAQRSDGEKSPRIFIFVNKVIMSIVPSGQFKDNIEFSFLVNSQQSVKGDLLFPIEQNISESLPFERVITTASIRGEQTSCGFCHQNETAGPSVNSYISNTIKPNGLFAVPLADLQRYYKNCNPQEDLERCQMYNSLFRFGTVKWQEFPTDMPN